MESVRAGLTLWGEGLSQQGCVLVTVMVTVIDGMPTSLQSLCALTCCPKRVSVGDGVLLSSYGPHVCLGVCTRPVLYAGQRIPAGGHGGQGGPGFSRLLGMVVSVGSWTRSGPEE